MPGKFGAVLAVTVFLGSAANAVDLHQFWDSRCGDCHGHAAPFALREREVIGKANGLPIAEFLMRHGKLSPNEVQPVVESLTRVLGEVGSGQAK